MDEKLTQDIKRWLETPADTRDIAAGAMLLLKLNKNRIMYNNILRAPKANASMLEYQLTKFYNFRLARLTHEQVEVMQQQANEIIAKRHLDDTRKKNVYAQIKNGKRADHDSLPDEIKKCYTDNLDIMRRMRKLHLQLTSSAVQNATCVDSERYPFLKELIELDKQYHANWKQYDEYVA